MLGPNGAGKSTLLRAVAGLLAVDRGEIRLFEHVLDAPARDVFLPPEARGVGVVFQDHRLFPHLRVLDNVAFGPRVARGGRRRRPAPRRWLWIDRLGLTGLADRPPRRLSGGQAQRVALARALAATPSALLLDEPLAALDVQTRAEVQGELREHLADFAGPTLLVTHDPVEALVLADLDRSRRERHGRAAGQPRRDQQSAGHRLRREAGRHEPLPRHGAARHGVPRRRRIGDVRRRAGRRGARRDPALGVHRARRGTAGQQRADRLDRQLRSLAPIGDRVRLTVDAGRPVLVDVTPAAVAALRLAPGAPVWLTAKATDVSAYPDVAR